MPSMRKCDSIPQDSDKWMGHNFVVVNFWPHGEKVPKHDGRTLRPTAICSDCGVTHWRGRKMGTFGVRSPDGKRRAYIPPSDCGEAYLPYGVVPTWRKGRIVDVKMASCVPSSDEALLASLREMRIADAAVGDVARQQDELSDLYEQKWDKAITLAHGLFLPMVPALIKAARSASAKKGAVTLRTKAK